MAVRCKGLAAFLVVALTLVMLPTTAGAAPSQPPRPTSGFGSSEGYVSAGATEFSTGSAVTGTQVWWFVPDTLRDGATAPVVVFLHGFALLAPDIYQGHIDHLTRQGIIVVYPQFNQGFPLLLFDNNQNTMRARAIDATNDALASIGSSAGPIHLYGHSLGALIASTWTAGGGPAPASVTLANPSTGAGGPFGGTGINWQQDAAATTAPTILLTGSADTIAPSQQAIDLYAAMTGAPSRVVHQARTDTYGSPDLDADHMAPIQDDGIIPSFMMDFLGGDGEDDAMDHRFYQAALDAAIAGQSTLTFETGQWGDGRAVNAAIVLAADLPQPGIDATMTTSTPTRLVGEAIAYEVEVTNTGEVPITGVSVTATSVPGCTRTAGSLPTVGVGESTTVSCTRATTAADRGTVLADATVDSDQTDGLTTQSVSAQVLLPAITVLKAASVTAARTGDVIDYTVTITNVGDVPITDVAVDDPTAPDCDRAAGVLSPLAVDTSIVVDCVFTPTTQAHLGGLVNTATVDGSPLTAPVVSNEVTVQVDIAHHLFTDVLPWADEAVDWISWDPDAGGPAQPVATGFGTSFRPDDSLTRAQIARMLYRLAGEPSVAGLDLPFTDVPPWAAPAVTWAYHDDIVEGFGTLFRPGDPLNRAQLARMLYRLADEPSVSGLSDPFDDVPVWAAPAVTWAFNAGIISGFGDEFRPLAPASRAQVARMLFRLNREVGLVAYPAA